MRRKPLQPSFPDFLREGRVVVVLGVFASLNLFVGMVELGHEHRKFARLRFTKFLRDEELLESNAEQFGSVGSRDRAYTEEIVSLFAWRERAASPR